VTSPRRPLILALLALPALLTGCNGQNRSAAQQQVVREEYSGPTLPMTDVVDRINANNRQIQTLWARLDYEVSIIDDDKKRHHLLGDGVLLYAKPQDLRLVGMKVGLGTVFEIGSSSRDYWLKVDLPDENQKKFWWGRYKNLGKPCAAEMPIPPDLILEVLAVPDINRSFLQSPAPTMRFSREEDAYLFVWAVRAPDRWVAQKETWYDRQTLRPRRVMLYDANGRVVLRAELSNFRQVDVDGVPDDKRPWVAATYQLRFPEQQSTMRIEFSDVKLQNRGIPRPGSIERPTDTGDLKVIQIDANCGD
jgi:hypothetical protein